MRILSGIVKSILYEFQVQQAGFSLRILVAGEKGVTLQENIVKEAPCLNKKYSFYFIDFIPLKQARDQARACVKRSLEDLRPTEH